MVGYVRKSWWRPLTLVVLIAGVVAAVSFTPLRRVFDQQVISRVLGALGAWAPAGYLIMAAAVIALGAPAVILTIISGALFGVMLGSAVAIAQAVLGATGAFLIARYLARDWVQAKLSGGGRLARLEQGLQQDAFWYVLSLRMTPLLPFNVLNSLFGLTGISLKNFCLGTFLGILPGTVIYTWLGASGQDALSGGTWGILGGVAALGLLALLPVVANFKRRREAQLAGTLSGSKVEAEE